MEEHRGTRAEGSGEKMWCEVNAESQRLLIFSLLKIGHRKERATRQNPTGIRTQSHRHTPDMGAGKNYWTYLLGRFTFSPGGTDVS